MSPSDDGEAGLEGGEGDDDDVDDDAGDGTGVATAGVWSALAAVGLSSVNDDVVLSSLSARAIPVAVLVAMVVTARVWLRKVRRETSPKASGIETGSSFWSILLGKLSLPRCKRVLVVPLCRNVIGCFGVRGANSDDAAQA